ncbi:uncharacterized protein N7482_004601 [Penicillium canariense]|uniref:Uncharacterized protein n=1 Tax=Penicillium canariense TaxID=189055 RepID=A0A9W9ICQ5_9EURO|nr:uncharacterized protein N7482_004601 [Penicillium canariense]KAJ5169007.1 hypothetical protein N7482_004601 [Penicillium canariense]
MPRPTAALQQWLNLRQNLSPKFPATLSPRANNLLTPPKCLALTISPNATFTSHRPFHSTQYKSAKPGRGSARPAPALRMKKRNEAAQQALAQANGGPANPKGLNMRAIAGDYESKFGWFCTVAGSVYDAAVAAGHLPNISFRTFEDVSIKLFKASLEGRPNAQAIRSISTDVDAVYRIGFISAVNDYTLSEWVISSCALAKSRHAVVLTQGRLINWAKVPPTTEWTTLVKQFSDEGFPPAMVLQAKILGLHGQYKEAFKLMEERVLPYLKPTRRKPGLYTDITMTPLIESPWRVYALLHASYDDKFDSQDSRQKADEATRIAALEYNDSAALVEYASIMLNEKNYDKYEECMSKAATLGNLDAILYIANFYYLTFHGKYPTQAERVALSKADAKGPKSHSTPPELSSTPDTKPDTKPNGNVLSSAIHWMSSFFNQSMSREEYRKLALEWYNLGNHFHIKPSMFMLALMAREQGEDFASAMVLEMAKLDEDPEYAAKIEELKENWQDPNYVPKLSSKMLAVR